MCVANAVMPPFSPGNRTKMFLACGTVKPRVRTSAANWTVDVNKIVATEQALRAGIASVDDLAGIGERIAKAFPSAEQVFGRTVVCCGQCGSDQATKRAIDGMIVCGKCGAWTEEG